MGVIYKLKQEVVDFILEQKKNNSSLSCRKIVDVVYQTFQTKISKSSVNALLKNEKLSSPVGRRAIGGKKQLPKFQIPQDKKPLLFAAKDSGKEEKVLPPAKQVFQENPPAPPLLPSRPQIEKIKTPLHDPAKKETVSSKEGRLLRKENLSFQEGVLYDGMGTVFLQAIQQELCGGSILGGFLKKGRKDEGLVNFDAIGDILLLAKVFGINKPGDFDVYSQKGLWAISGAQKPVPGSFLSSMMNGVHDIKGLAIDIAIELGQLLTEVNRIKILLEDGTSLFTDAHGFAIYGENVQSERYFPLYKITENISKQIINNVQTAIFCQGFLEKNSSTNDFPGVFEKFLLAFENEPGKRIASVSIYDAQEEIAVFDAIPHIKRLFSCGVWPTQSGFSIFADSEKIRQVDSLEIPWLNKKIYFREVEADCSTGAGSRVCLRGILLRESLSAAPFMAILTNANMKNIETKEVIKNYFYTWPTMPFGEKPGDTFNRLSSLPSTLQLANTQRLMENSFVFDDIIEELLLLLNTCVQKTFFPSLPGEKSLSEMISAVYNIPGFMKQEKNFTGIKFFITGKEQIPREELSSAIRRFNERGFYDASGKKVFLYL